MSYRTQPSSTSQLDLGPTADGHENDHDGAVNGSNLAAAGDGSAGTNMPMRHSAWTTNVAAKTACGGRKNQACVA